MYESHFGLARRPFAETLSPSVYVAVPSRDTVLRRLHYSLTHTQAPAVLFGPTGLGKTLLARRLASELGGTVIHVTFPALSAVEMITHIAQELGGPTLAPESLHAALTHVRDQLNALASRGQRLLLIIDDAHLIESTSTFEALRMLLNYATTGPSDLSLLFVGGAELLLDLPAGLADRIGARCLLSSLTEAESSMYVQGRLAAAGASIPLFPAEALSALHRASDGLPRRLNRLADLSLLIAYAQDRATIDATMVAVAAQELNRDLAA